MNDDTPWLNEQENRIWRSFLEATTRINTRLNATLKQAGDLTLDDYEVLVHLSEAEPRRLRMTDLSRRLLHSQSRVTQRVDRLVKRGLVSREKCADDGRGTFAVLTDAGLETITATAPLHVRDVRAVLIDLIDADERGIVLDVFKRLAACARSTEDE